MNQLNIANCGTSGQTGPVSCNIEPGLFKYPVFIPKGSVVPATSFASQAAFLTYLMARLTDSNRATQWFLGPAMDSFKDSTDADKTETRDSFKPYTDKSKYIFEYRLTCLKCDFVNLAKVVHLQQSKYDILYIDDIGNVLGTKGTDSTGAAGMGGFTPYQIWVPDYKPRKYGETNTYMLMIQFEENAQFNANMVGYGAGLVVASIQYTGLQSVILSDLTVAIAPAANTAAIGGSLSCGASLLGLTYGTTIAAASAWQVYDNTADPSHASPITPASVSYVPPVGTTDGYYLFTFTVAPVATHVFSFQLAAPSVLLATPYFINIISETAVTHTF